MPTITALPSGPRIVELRGEIKVTNERLEGVEKLQDVLKDQVAVMDEYLRKAT